MAKRKIQGEVNEAILDIGKSRRPPEDDDVLDEEDDSGDESDADLEVDDQGDSTEVAMIESRRTQPSTRTLPPKQALTSLFPSPPPLPRWP